MRGPAVVVAPATEPLGHGIGAGVVEAHAVDQCLVLDDAEHPWLGITGLLMAGDAAEFAETEAKRLPCRDCCAGLIHAGCEADGVGKRQPKQLDRQAWPAEKPPRKAQCTAPPRRPAELIDDEVVRLLGVAIKKVRSNECLVKPRHGPIKTADTLRGNAGSATSLRAPSIRPTSIRRAAGSVFSAASGRAVSGRFFH